MRPAILKDLAVFIDTNILIYAFTDTRFTSSCEQILDSIQDESLAGYLNTTVIDEFFHKTLLTCLYIEKGLVPSQAIL